jgi:O-antigen/teichoic acid export membrane protein
MSDSRYIFRGSIINMLGMALRTALSPLALLLPRFFPPAIFGVFVSLRSIITVWRQLVVFDFKRGLAWWIPRRQAEGELTNAAVWSALVFAVGCSILGSLILGLVFLFFGSYIPEELRSISPAFLFICLASIPGMAVLDCACGCMDGIRKPKYSAFYGTPLALGLQPIFSIAMYFAKVPHSLAWGLFAANWLCALIVLWRVKECFPIGREKLGLFPERRLLEYSIPMALSNWASSGLVNVDLWLVAWMVGPVESGIYGVMKMLADGVRKVRLSYDPLIVPVISRMEEDTINEKLPEVLSYSIHMVSSLQLIVALFLVCFYREILSISGAQFAGFGTAFILLTAANLVGGFSGISNQALLGLGKSTLVFQLNFALMVVTFAAGYFLIPSFGMTGAAILSLLMRILQTVIQFYMQVRIHGRWPYKKDFFVNASWACGFIVGTSLAAPWFSGASLILRVSVFLLVTAVLGVWAYTVRKSFIPAETPHAGE